MTPENFAYWLQGYFEINNPKTLNKEQTQCIKKHLDLVFKNVTSKKGFQKVMPDATFKDALSPRSGSNILYC